MCLGPCTYFHGNGPFAFGIDGVGSAGVDGFVELEQSPTEHVKRIPVTEGNR